MLRSARRLRALLYRQASFGAMHFQMSSPTPSTSCSEPVAQHPVILDNPPTKIDTCYDDRIFIPLLSFLETRRDQAGRMTFHEDLVHESKLPYPVDHREPEGVMPTSCEIYSERNAEHRLPLVGETGQFVSLSSEVFAHPIRRDILHACLVQFLDGQRQGTASTKTRHEVRGSGRKLFQQKGTGKARVGDARSPIRRGGGVAFGPKPRDFSTRLPRKVRKMGMRVAWSTKVRSGTLMAVNSLEWRLGKTKRIAERLRQLGWHSNLQILFVTGKARLGSGLERSCRNLKGVDVKEVKDVTIHDILRCFRIVIDLEGLEHLERTLCKNSLVPEPDSRRKESSLSRREARRVVAEARTRRLNEQILQLQYLKRFGDNKLMSSQ